MKLARSVSKDWNDFWQPDKLGQSNMGNPEVFKAAADFLDIPEIRRVEDWGCGHGKFANALPGYIQYIGIDGSQNSAASAVVALEDYESRTPGIFMRGVLEHNDAWLAILRGFLNSFIYRGVLVMWLPFVEEHRCNREGKHLVHRFTREEIVPVIEQSFKAAPDDTRAAIAEEREIPNHKQGNPPETVFFLERCYADST